ncbi:MAG: hypothetical protein M1821_004220 [Bathelium mastoideum]|nr:MAG: hypothetical protein M1821_004220 [Bathelium mastoideum]
MNKKARETLSKLIQKQDNLVWLNVKSTEYKIKDIHSKYNERELILSIYIVSLLLQNGYQAKDIILLSPYLTQKSLIERTINFLSNKSGLKDLCVITFDSCQGGEAEVVVMPVISTFQIGFLKALARIDVATCRSYQLFESKEVKAQVNRVAVDLTCCCSKLSKWRSVEAKKWVG